MPDPIAAAPEARHVAAPGAQRQQNAMPLQHRAAMVQPASFNAEQNTVRVMWSEGVRVRRYDWWNDRVYEEELVVTPESVDMSRFEAGAVQVLDSHNGYGVRSILGIAQRGWIENGQAWADLRLSRREELAGIVQDIRDGVIRDVSAGYSVERYEITRAIDRTDGGTVDLWRAVRWTPQEISFVPVPADPAAGTRSQAQQGAQFPVEFTRAMPAIQQEPTMPQGTQAGNDTTPAADNQAALAAAEAARAAEAQRSADITELCARHGVAQLAAGLIRGNSTVDAARSAVLEELARRDAASGGHTNVRGIQTVTDETETRLQGMEEALMLRVDPRAKMTENGNQYRGMSLLEMGRDYLEFRGVRTRGMDRMHLAGQVLQFRSPGMMSTSDFANLLQNVATKRLRRGYDVSAPSYRRWAREAPNAPDFKSMSVVNLAGAPDLRQVNEHGEFTYGSMTDGKETYSLITYGRIVAFTRQAMVNDDLRGFDRLVGAFGDSAARLENRTVYSILTANAALADTGNLFNATAVTTAGGHANLTSSGTAISLTSLNVGRTMMRLQKGLQSEELNVAPRYLIVPATQEMLAYQYTSANYVPTAQSGVSEFSSGGRSALEVVVEAYLDASSTTAWYLAADSAQVDTVEFCHLEGATGPVIESEMGFEVDGMAMKCRLDFAAKAIDFRGLYKNVGA